MTRRSARGLVVRVAIVLVVSFLGAEIGLRVFGVGAFHPSGYPAGMWEHDDVLSFRLKPDFEGDMEGDALHAIRTNADGFRDDPFGPKEPGVFRVAALGDSFGFGHNVLAEESYPERLEALLTNDARRVEVLNLGVPGYNTLQELEQLQLLGETLELDLVLLGCYLGNDISGNLESRVARTRVRYGVLIQADPGESDASVTWRATLNNYCRLWRVYRQWNQRRNLRSLEQDAGALRGMFCENLQWSAGVAFEILRREPTPDGAEAYAITRNTLRELARHSREELGVPFALVLIPSPYQYHPAAFAAVGTQCGFDLEDYDVDYPQRELAAAGEADGYPVLDLTPALRRWCVEHPGEKPYFDVHLDQAGHLLAAEEIAAFLEREGLTP